MSDEQRDGFHFGVFEADVFRQSETRVLDGFGRMSGHVEAHPHGLAAAALREVCRLDWLEDGEYVVVGVRLRDHMVVAQRGWVRRGRSTREALVIATTDDEALLEGEVLDARAS